MISKNKMVMMITVVLSLTGTTCLAQVQNPKTETVKIYGNCGMCERPIERAALVKNVAKAEWNKETKMAVVTYDSTITTLEEVLQRIAKVGYDSDMVRSSDAAYNNLPECCQYERPKKQEDVNEPIKKTEPEPHHH